VIVAIGGSASVGKTTLASKLSGRLGPKDVVHVDDIRLLLEADNRGPNFIESTPDVWHRSPDWLRDQLIQWTSRLHPHIDRLLAELGKRGGGVIEGEGIDPRVAQSWSTDVVRVVYVIETDPQVLYRTFAGRASGHRFLALSPAERDGVVEMNRRYGLWLQESADTHRQPWVSSQPWATLAERALRALQL
jgi:2-phosphoglycerate kinase